VLTCTSAQSRNFRFGLALGKGESFDPSVTVEGVATARPLCAGWADWGRDAGDSDGRCPCLGPDRVKDAVGLLMGRPLKQE
jgi:glycerol-3-phosphate dehydrogenase (NAD(P)+)